eukprot:SAG22_NODE_360_length_11744_cov_37.781623_8_plen_68_part_00
MVTRLWGIQILLLNEVVSTKLDSPNFYARHLVLLVRRGTQKKVEDVGGTTPYAPTTTLAGGPPPPTA